MNTIDRFLNQYIWVTATNSWEDIIENTTTFERCQMAAEHLKYILERERYDEMVQDARHNFDVIPNISEGMDTSVIRGENND